MKDCIKTVGSTPYFQALLERLCWAADLIMVAQKVVQQKRKFPLGTFGLQVLEDPTFRPAVIKSAAGAASLDGLGSRCQVGCQHSLPEGQGCWKKNIQETLQKLPFGAPSADQV